jgi:hypothetical protein
MMNIPCEYSHRYSQALLGLLHIRLLLSKLTPCVCMLALAASTAFASGQSVIWQSRAAAACMVSTWANLVFSQLQIGTYHCMLAETCIAVTVHVSSAFRLWYAHTMNCSSTAPPTPLYASSNPCAVAWWESCAWLAACTDPPSHSAAPGDNQHVLCLLQDMQGNTWTPGDAVIIKGPCHAGSAQKWTFNPSLTIQGDGAAVCAMVASATAGTAVTIQNCDAAQLTHRWLYDDQARLRSLAAPQLCMWAGSNPGSGSALTLNPCAFNQTSYQWNATGEMQGAAAVCGPASRLA